MGWVSSSVQHQSSAWVMEWQPLKAYGTGKNEWDSARLEVMSLRGSNHPGSFWSTGTLRYWNRELELPLSLPPTFSLPFLLPFFLPSFILNQIKMNISFLQVFLWGWTYFHQVTRASRNKIKNPKISSRYVSEVQTSSALSEEMACQALSVTWASLVRSCSDRQGSQAQAGPRSKALVTIGEGFGTVSQVVSSQGLSPVESR